VHDHERTKPMADPIDDRALVAYFTVYGISNTHHPRG
jgi:hypothetical protein